MTAASLWRSANAADWTQALKAYPAALERAGGERLRELDAFVRHELPAKLRAAEPKAIDLADLDKVVRWKMARGTFRPRNLRLLRENDEAEVRRRSRAAFAAIPDPREPLAILAALAGVGPATASAVLGALRPELYPFFDDRIADAIPGFGDIKFTLPEYVRYAAVLGIRAAAIGGAFKAQTVGEALWAASVLAESGSV